MPTETHDRLIAQRVLVRDLPDRSRIVATLRIDHLAGNEHPYFSATCDLYEPRGTHSGAARQRAGRDMDSGGASHATILAAFPGAAAFVRMHLANYPSGEPMHAVSNAFYFLSGKAERHELEQYGAGYVMRAGTPLTRCARTLRCDVDEIPYELQRAATDGTLNDGEGPAFAAFVDTLRPRWAAEARAARELLELMPDATDLRGYGMSGQAIDRKPLPAWLIGADPETVNI